MFLLFFFFSEKEVGKSLEVSSEESTAFNRCVSQSVSLLKGVAGQFFANFFLMGTL